MSLNLKKAKKLAEESALDAGQIILKSKQLIKIKKYKDTQDILTNIDLEVEKHIIARIEKTYPDHNIISEETGEINKNSKYTWIIDPLDGTKEYIRKIPLYCTAIMLQYRTQPIVSAVYDPELKELYSASKDNGAHLNGEKIKVTQQDQLKNSFLFTYLPKNSQAWLVLNQLNQQVYRIRGHANHNMSYCWVAKGGYDAHINLYDPPKWWDCAPGLLVILEAGGKVTNLEGEVYKYGVKFDNIIATNGKLHQQLISAIQAIIKSKNH